MLKSSTISQSLFFGPLDINGFKSFFGSSKFGTKPPTQATATFQGETGTVEATKGEGNAKGNTKHSMTHGEKALTIRQNERNP